MTYVKVRNYRSGLVPLLCFEKEETLSGKINTAEKVREMASEPAAELGLELWDVEFKKEGQRWVLRLIIDKPGGVSIDDCVAMSEKIGELLDRNDPTDVSYNLQVQSPGAERQLRRDSHFIKYIGSRVKLRLISALDGKRNFSGVLDSYSEGNITLLCDDGNKMLIKKSDTSKVNLDDIEDF